MTFSDEPGIYIRGEFGIRLEDDMHITEGGAELLTPQSPSLENPFGEGVEIPIHRLSRRTVIDSGSPSISIGLKS